MDPSRPMLGLHLDSSMPTSIQASAEMGWNRRLCAVKVAVRERVKAGLWGMLSDIQTAVQSGMETALQNALVVAKMNIADPTGIDHDKTGAAVQKGILTTAGIG
jgi:hypothetical protein